jgi:hypothetical protein
MLSKGGADCAFKLIRSTVLAQTHASLAAMLMTPDTVREAEAEREEALEVRRDVPRPDVAGVVQAQGISDNFPTARG